MPRDIRAAFLCPAATIFALFALIGFWAALAPTVLKQQLHEANLAVGGLIVGELFIAGVVAI